MHSLVVDVRRNSGNVALRVSISLLLIGDEVLRRYVSYFHLERSYVLPTFVLVATPTDCIPFIVSAARAPHR